MRQRPGGAPREPGLPDATPSVRPYLVTRGRTRSAHDELPLETLVRSGGSDLEGRAAAGPVSAGPESAGPVSAGSGMTTEVRSIMELTRSAYLSVAELSAHVHLPVPVVRVVLEDLAGQGLVHLHPPERSVDERGHRAVPRHVLERVLDGISRL